MKADVISGRWHDLGAAAKARWAELDDAEIARIAGDRAQLEAALQALYGRSQEQAAAEVEHWLTQVFAQAGQPKKDPSSGTHP